MRLEPNITPHIPVKDMSDRDDGTFSSSDFTFDRERNVYVSTNAGFRSVGAREFGRPAHLFLRHRWWRHIDAAPTL